MSTFFVERRRSVPARSGRRQEPLLVPLMPTHIKGSKTGPRDPFPRGGRLFEPISLFFPDLFCKCPAAAVREGIGVLVKP